MKKIYTILLALVALLVGAAYSDEGSAGQAGELLRSGLGARSFALGRAYTVMPTGADAIAWNPGGLGKLTRWELTLMHAQGYLDSRLEFGSFAIPIGEIGAFSVGVVNEGESKIDGRDQFNRPTEELSWGETVAMLGWGKSLFKNKLYAGIAGKFVMKNLGDESASGLGGFDFGLITKDYSFKYRLGLTVSNIGAGKVAGDAYPMTIRAGAGAKLFGDLYLTADGEFISGRGISPHVGAEYSFDWLAIRAGYDVMKPEITFGLGFMIDQFAGRVAGTYPRLDYAGGAMGPIGNTYARLGLTILGEEKQRLEDIEGDPCAQLSSIEPHMTKRGFEGAKANLIYGGCRFRYESVEAPLDANPGLSDIFTFFNEAYYGKYGSNWHVDIAIDDLARSIFSQKTHYMFAETRMARSINQDTKNLIEKLIEAGGDSAQYDVRLQYDLAYVNEILGDTATALRIYNNIAGLGTDNPVKALALYRSALILQYSDKERAAENLETLIDNYAVGFYDEDGYRLSYPMFPKYRDNSVVDDATLLLGDIVFSMASDLKSGDPENYKKQIRKALGLYLDILIFFPEMEKSILKQAADKAAICYMELGDEINAQAMTKIAQSI